MKLQNRTVQIKKIIRDTYVYDSIEEREEHLADMQCEDWVVERTDRRKEKGFQSTLRKEVFEG